MKITSVECYLGDKGLGGFVTVKVNTDEGISGFGEAGLAYGKCSEAAFGQCQDFARMVLGMDPFNTEEIWEHLHRHTFWGMGGGVVVTSAMAAIDTACWDIKGKALNMPVYKLIGGKTNKKLRAYASQLQFGWRTLIEKNDALTLLYDPKDYYDVVKDAMAEGYDAVKIDPVFAPLEERPMAEVMATQGNQIRGCYREHDLTRSVERIAAAREAGGPDLDIIVEIHSLLDANTAALLGQALEPYRIMYYEEPTMPCNPGVFKHIKERCKLPLATGERSYTRWGFRQFFEDRTLDIIQPDLCTTAAGRCGLVCAGGSTVDAETFLTQLYDQIHTGGAVGNATGRNIHQRSLDEAVRLTKAISAITLDDYSVEDAMAVFNGEKDFTL